jgi:hypothetical protein
MKYEARHRPSCELRVHPARSIAAMLAGLVLVGIIAVFYSGLNALTSFVASLLLVLVGLQGLYRLLFPGLALRLSDEGLQYQWRGRPWASRVQRPFVSPWFIGWRGEGIRGFGVFPSQLSADGFRRLARALRQGRSQDSG